MSSDLKKAREWAEYALTQWPTDGAKAAAEIILSPPDQWVDAEIVRGLIKPYIGSETAGPALWHLAKDLEDLLPTPPLPTLADMTPEEREAYQWMQADFQGPNGEMRVVITKSHGATVDVLLPSGAVSCVYADTLTPLPDLPPLKWPGQEARNPETPPEETLNNTSSDTPRNSEEIVKVIRHEKELCLSSQDFSRAMLWKNMERAAGQGEWKDLLNSIRELKLPKDSDSTLISRLVPERKENA